MWKSAYEFLLFSADRIHTIITHIVRIEWLKEHGNRLGRGVSQGNNMSQNRVLSQHQRTFPPFDWQTQWLTKGDGIRCAQHSPLIFFGYHVVLASAYSGFTVCIVISIQFVVILHIIVQCAICDRIRWPRYITYAWRMAYGASIFLHFSFSVIISWFVVFVVFFVSSAIYESTMDFPPVLILLIRKLVD